MHGQGHIFLLGSLVALSAGILTSLAFNIDVNNPKVHFGEAKDFFGYKVLQFKSGGNKGIIVTAPLQRNGSGGICRPDQNTPCFTPKEISLQNATIPVKHLGLSIAEDPTSSHFTVCSPSVAHECYENTYLNSVCYKITDKLQPLSTFKPVFQECTKKTVDLVFLFDGSGSMTGTEFNKNKDFIEDIMKTLKSTSIKFAAVQFATDCRKVFDFNDYLADTALVKLRNEEHYRKLTNTHKALNFVLDQIFENPASGVTPDSTKVVVLITDGDPSDSDRNKVIQKYDNGGIIRFVIGVKNASLEKFTAIASEPKDKNAFKIENYDGLTGILENFQKKVFSLEGSKVARAGNMVNEMSQTGFSAAFYKDTLILGSVGTNSWKGSLQELKGQTTTHVEDSQMEMNSYMGYSIAVGERNGVPLCFTGAPRFMHTGQVVLFKYNRRKWTTTRRINGEKFGSYFGAELCSVDVNSDGDTDFLLVGAPLFYQPSEKKEGQIYVYSVIDETQLTKQLVVSAPSMGRFGTTISSLADLNGDKLRDVAVGAPLEDENRGVVYIFLGDKVKGIRETPSQRIMGQKINSKLRFFGQAIDGDIDLGEDGLTDIVVGSQGMAVVLSSLPVFKIIAFMSYDPEEISTDKIDCLGNTDEVLPMVNLTVCFIKIETTESKAETPGLNITYTLDMDPMRQKNRGFFSELDKKVRSLTSTSELTERETCFNYPTYMQKCVKDTLSPIPIKLHFSQADRESAGAVLNVDSRKQTSVEIRFEKQCRGNDTCEADLEVDFNFTNLTLLVTEDMYFNVTIELSNHGDDSYNTSLTMHYPPGLSFSRMTLIKWSRPILHSCYDLKDVLDKTICGVSRPVFRSQSSATFLTSFLVLTNYEWNDTISMTVTGNSDNDNSTRTNSLTKIVPVQFEVKMALTVIEDSVTYLNFTPEDSAPKKMVALYKIDNPGFKAFPVNVTFYFPYKLEPHFEMTNYQVFVKQNKTDCVDIRDVEPKYCSTEKYCKSIKCDNFILEKESAVEFVLSGDIQFINIEQHAEKITFLKYYTGDKAEVRFKSFLHVDFDKQRYLLRNKQEDKSNDTGLWKDNDPTVKLTEIQLEIIAPPNEALIIGTGAGVGFLLLIIITIIMFKLGCFKRKTLEDYQAEDAALHKGSISELTPLPTDEKAIQSETQDLSEQDKPVPPSSNSDQAPEEKKAD
ncbi:LOW QUALITY PROTEIN: integrin alpha-M [Xyrichtys novacula]|uniref:LOW QUALITY PROTEIN: integrin alpha-M n=1 Tax=Xyrichtys novacula TaxID=13765 RepID=A0AAV1EWM7_XYRNO|nr:LOW QUALITY PROTEIN: integrin alpha-M [Xyrichtys novacula]